MITEQQFKSDKTDSMKEHLMLAALGTFSMLAIISASEIVMLCISKFW